MEELQQTPALSVILFTGMQDVNTDQREILKRVHEELKSLYGTPRLHRRDFNEVMLRTILSQNTNDDLRDRAYLRLKRRFPRLEDLEKASVEEIVEVISVCGLARQKAQTIKNYLAWLRRKYGRLRPRGICDENTQSLLSELLSIKGVGEKTARVVLAFACGRDMFPVDTHIHRVLKRLGVIPSNASRELAHKLVPDLLPEGVSAALHLNLIRFGREICQSRKPRCASCPFSSFCPSFSA